VPENSQDCKGAQPCRCRVLVRRCSRAAAAVPAAALRPLCAVLKAGAAWQQTDAIVAHLVQKEIGSREFLMPSSLKALGRPAHHQVPSFPKDSHRSLWQLQLPACDMQA
jgi:hypothetical protein